MGSVLRPHNPSRSERRIDCASNVRSPPALPDSQLVGPATRTAVHIQERLHRTDWSDTRPHRAPPPYDAQLQCRFPQTASSHLLPSLGSPCLGAGTRALACPYEDALCASGYRSSLEPGRGRQSSAQGFTFSTAGGDTSPGNLPHVSRSLSLVGSPRSASLARERSPGLPPQIVAASHLGFLTPPPSPPLFFLGLQI